VHKNKVFTPQGGLWEKYKGKVKTLARGGGKRVKVQTYQAYRQEKEGSEGGAILWEGETVWKKEKEEVVQEREEPSGTLMQENEVGDFKNEEGGSKVN